MSATPTATFTVTGMTCGHCAAAVRNEVGQGRRRHRCRRRRRQRAGHGRVARPGRGAGAAVAVEEAGYEVTAS